MLFSKALGCFLGGQPIVLIPDISPAFSLEEVELMQETLSLHTAVSITFRLKDDPSGKGFSIQAHDPLSDEFICDLKRVMGLSFYEVPIEFVGAFSYNSVIKELLLGNQFPHKGACFIPGCWPQTFHTVVF